MSGLNATTVVDLRMTVDVSDWEASAAITSSESVTFNFNSKTGPLLSTMGARREITPERQLFRHLQLTLNVTTVPLKISPSTVPEQAFNLFRDSSDFQTTK